MLDINWQILAYAGIFLAGLGVLIACVSAARTLGTVRKSLAAATECVEDVTDIAEDALKLAQDLNETIKKVEGKTYIGHYDVNGKPAGEWKLKDGSVRQCFLKDGEITEVKGNYFKKISKNMDLLISYGNYGQRPAIDVYNVFVKKNGERTDNYLYLEKYNGKYSKKLGRLLLLDEIKPLYEQERVLKDDASIPLEMIKK